VNDYNTFQMLISHINIAHWNAQDRSPDRRIEKKTEPGTSRLYCIFMLLGGARGSVVVKALSYKSEGRGIASR
jgi:hypothetical protein